MSFHFKKSDKTAQVAVRRVALGQIDAALAEIDGKELTPEQIVHQVRKRCKKLRALIQLVRPGLSNHARENAAFRDLARMLSGVRDQDVLIHSCDRIAQHFGKDADPDIMLGLRERLVVDKEERTSSGLDGRLADFRNGMVQARERAQMWIIEGDGFAAFAGGLCQVLKRARGAMAQARRDPTPDAMHEWRKRVKYHAYQARLFSEIWPEMMQVHISTLSELADLLGEHHDMAVLQHRLAERPHDYGGAEAVRHISGLAHELQENIADASFRSGARLLAERPKALARRWENYWQLWRGEE